MEDLNALSKEDAKLSLEKTPVETLWDSLLSIQVALTFSQEMDSIKGAPFWENAKAILEIGSGNGCYLYHMKESSPDKVFIGMEKEQHFVDSSNQSYEDDRLFYILGNAEAPQKNLEGQFDIVLFRLTLQHLKDPIAALKNAFSYLKPDGHVLIYDSCDAARRSSSPVHCLTEALNALNGIKERGNKINRLITLQVLKEILENNLPLSSLYEVHSTNLDPEGVRLPGSFQVILSSEKERSLWFNHILIFFELLQKSWDVSIDMLKAYDELKAFSKDPNFWWSSGLHQLILKKK